VTKKSERKKADAVCNKAYDRAEAIRAKTYAKAWGIWTKKQGKTNKSNIIWQKSCADAYNIYNTTCAKADAVRNKRMEEIKAS